MKKSILIVSLLAPAGAALAQDPLSEVAALVTERTPEQVIAQWQAEEDQRKRSTYVWTCDCVNGVPVFSYKSLAQIEAESNARTGRQAALTQRLAANSTLPAEAQKQAALAMANACRKQ